MEDVGEDDGGVGEDHGDDDGPRQRSGATGSKGERAPPSSSSSLTSSLDRRKFLLWSMASMEAEGPEPLRDWICLSVFSLFLRSAILPWHRFLYIWRSVTPIGLKPSP